jgi:hypothetical protein
MPKRISASFPVLWAVSLACLLSACTRVTADATRSGPERISPQPRLTESDARPAHASPTIDFTRTPPPADNPTPTVPAKVTITAVKGNLFVRRGPDLAFNPVGVLYEGTSAVAIGQDMLSNWVQVELPHAGGTGWISVRTRYSDLSGDPASLPRITQTEWPLAAYLRNCTHHRMYILPAEITLPSSLEFPENEVWLYPGRYTVYDLDVPDEPAVMDVDVREGIEVEVRVDGLGEKRKCP